MLTNFRTSIDAQRYRRVFLFIALCSFLGALFGVFFAAFAGHPYLLLMRMAALHPVSIVDLTVAKLVPFLILFILVFFADYRWIYFLCFLRILFFSAGAWCVHRAFGAAGWLLDFFLQFQDIFLIPALLFLSMRRLCAQRCEKALTFCIFYAVFVEWIDYCAVSPSLALLLEKFEQWEGTQFHVGLDWCL